MNKRDSFFSSCAVVLRAFFSEKQVNCHYEGHGVRCGNPKGIIRLSEEATATNFVPEAVFYSSTFTSKSRQGSMNQTLLQKVAFSLGEALITLLLVSIVLAAIAPLMSKRMKLAQSGYSSFVKPKPYTAVFDDPAKNGTNENVFEVPDGLSSVFVTSIGGGGAGGDAMMGSQIVTGDTPNWIVPEGVTKIRVYMLGGGGGGASGGAGVGTEYGGIVSENQYLEWKTPGEYTLGSPPNTGAAGTASALLSSAPPLPSACQDIGAKWDLNISETNPMTVSVTACGAGGGGGGGYGLYSSLYLWGGGGGSGYSVINSPLNITQVGLPIIIGGGGVGGCRGCRSAVVPQFGGGGGCNGGGGSSPIAGTGGQYGGASLTTGHGADGVGVMSTAGVSGIGASTKGGRGGSVGGGGGGYGFWSCGAGGGGATVLGSYSDSLSSTKPYYFRVFAGGGGGAGCGVSGDVCEGGGGGGGGTGGGKGGDNGVNRGGGGQNSGAKKTAGVTPTGLPSGHCGGGDGSISEPIRGNTGQPGYLKIIWTSATNVLKCTYNMPATGSGGGGGGQVWLGEIDVPADRKLNFVVGVGGVSQTSYGANGNTGVQTKITNSSNTVLAYANGGGGGRYNSDPAQINNTYGVGGGQNAVNWKDWTGLNIQGGTNGANGTLNSGDVGGTGGNGGNTSFKDGTLMAGGTGGASSKSGISPSSTSYGAGGGGGGGANKGSTAGTGAAGADGYIYIEWGGSNAGGGSSGQVIDRKVITNLKYKAQIPITVGKGGVNSTDKNLGKGEDSKFGTTVTALGGNRGEDGGMGVGMHGKGGLSSGVGSLPGTDGLDNFGGVGGCAKYAIAQDKQGLGGCGGNIATDTCAGFKNPSALGKDGVKPGAGGGGGAMRNRTPHKGGHGADGVVIVEWE